MPSPKKGSERVDHYAVLGFELGTQIHDITSSDVKKAFRKMALKYHPDKGHPAAKPLFNRVQYSYEAIKEDHDRLSYNRWYGSYYKRFEITQKAIEKEIKLCEQIEDQFVNADKYAAQEASKAQEKKDSEARKKAEQQRHKQEAERRRQEEAAAEKERERQRKIQEKAKREAEVLERRRQEERMRAEERRKQAAFEDLKAKINEATEQIKEQNQRSASFSSENTTTTPETTPRKKYSYKETTARYKARVERLKKAGLYTSAPSPPPKTEPVTQPKPASPPKPEEPLLSKEEYLERIEKLKKYYDRAYDDMEEARKQADDLKSSAEKIETSARRAFEQAKKKFEEKMKKAEEKKQEASQYEKQSEELTEEALKYMDEFDALAEKYEVMYGDDLDEEKEKTEEPPSEPSTESPSESSSSGPAPPSSEFDFNAADTSSFQFDDLKSALPKETKAEFSSPLFTSPEAAKTPLNTSASDSPSKAGDHSSTPEFFKPFNLKNKTSTSSFTFSGTHGIKVDPINVHKSKPEQASTASGTTNSDATTSSSDPPSSSSTESWTKKYDFSKTTNQPNYGSTFFDARPSENDPKASPPTPFTFDGKSTSSAHGNSDFWPKKTSEAATAKPEPSIFSYPQPKSTFSYTPSSSPKVEATKPNTGLFGSSSSAGFSFGSTGSPFSTSSSNAAPSGGLFGTGASSYTASGGGSFGFGGGSTGGSFSFGGR